MKELAVLPSDIEKLATEEVHQAGIVLCPLGIGMLPYQAPLKKIAQDMLLNTCYFLYSSM
jgi:hypothetical protein